MFICICAFSSLYDSGRLLPVVSSTNRISFNSLGLRFPCLIESYNGYFITLTPHKILGFELLTFLCLFQPFCHCDKRLNVFLSGNRSRLTVLDRKTAQRMFFSSVLRFGEISNRSRVVDTNDFSTDPGFFSARKFALEGSVYAFV